MQEFNDFIPLHYDRDEALIDLQWATTLNWCHSNERAWRILRRVVLFIVREGEDPGPKEIEAQENKVETYIVYHQMRRYNSNVFKQATKAGQETAHGCGF